MIHSLQMDQRNFCLQAKKTADLSKEASGQNLLDQRKNVEFVNTENDMNRLECDKSHAHVPLDVGRSSTRHLGGGGEGRTAIRSLLGRGRRKGR